MKFIFLFSVSLLVYGGPNKKPDQFFICRLGDDCVLTHDPCGSKTAVNKSYQKQYIAWREKTLSKVDFSCVNSREDKFLYKARCASAKCKAIKKCGKDFSKKEEKMVWEKATIIKDQDKDKVRKDLCGAIIKFDKYGSKAREFKDGWEVDHIRPLEKGGCDEIENLQPLHWRNNVSKSDHFPITPKEYCKIPEKKWKKD